MRPNRKCDVANSPQDVEIDGGRLHERSGCNFVRSRIFRGAWYNRGTSATILPARGGWQGGGDGNTHILRRASARNAQTKESQHSKRSRSTHDCAPKVSPCSPLPSCTGHRAPWLSGATFRAAYTTLVGLEDQHIHRGSSTKDLRRLSTTASAQAMVRAEAEQRFCEPLLLLQPLFVRARQGSASLDSS